MNHRTLRKIRKKMSPVVEWVLTGNGETPDMDKFSTKELIYLSETVRKRSPKL